MGKASLHLAQIPLFTSRRSIKYQIFLFIFALGVGPGRAQTTTPYTGKLGVNLEGASPTFFVDLVKTAGPWHTLGNGAIPASQLDPNGWPTTDFQTLLLDARPVAEWFNQIDDPEVYRVDYSGTHHGSFSGQADLVSQGPGCTIAHQVYDAARNTTTFELVMGPPGPGYGFVALRFSNTRRTATAGLGTGVADLKVIRAGYPADSPQLFTNALVNALTGVNFSVIRAKDLTGTSNLSGVSYPATLAWADRRLPTDAQQTGGAGGKREATAWEHFIDLCNLTNRDIWVNVPIAASPDYVTQLATLLQVRLNPGLHIYVESDNEIWNNGFHDTWQYNKDQTVALGFTGYGADKFNHARRTHELSQLFAGVFGAAALNQRVRVVLCWHQPLRKWDVSQQMLPYLNTTFGPPKDYLYAIGTQTYFNPVGPAPATATAAQLLALCRPNIDAQVDEGPTTVNEAGRVQWVAAAAQWQLPGGLVSYEGGPGTAYGEGYTTNMAEAIGMHRLPAMKAEVKYNLKESWWDRGAGLAMHFTLSGSYQRYGQYGLTDDLTLPDRNAKYQAMRELVGPLGPLPVRLTSFVAEHQGPDYARLRWTTASEANSAQFVVERSADGLRFDAAGQLAAAGSSTEARAYAWPDPQPLVALTYYRLRQLDQDGTATLSPVVALAPPQLPAARVVARPNPAPAGAACVELQALVGRPLTVQVRNVLGQLVAQQECTPATGAETLRLDLPAATPPGVYFITVQGAGAVPAARLSLTR